MVERLTTKPKIKGSNPAPVGHKEKWQRQKVFENSIKFDLNGVEEMSCSIYLSQVGFHTIS